MFDNGLEQSRVIEISVPEGVIVWEYSAGSDFHSSWGGSVQRLPGGNTLITDSQHGEAFEVTPGGRTVWRFVNPRSNDGSVRGESIPWSGRWNIWRMTRYRREHLPFL